jgi:hypothetical protein
MNYNYISVSHILVSPWAWGASGFTANSENISTLWTTKLHTRVHRRPPCVPILRQTKRVRHLPSYCKIHFNVILSYTLGSYKRFLYIKFPQQNLVGLCISHAPARATWHTHLILLNFTHGKKYKSFSSSLRFFLHHATPLLFVPNIFLSIRLSPSAITPLFDQQNAHWVKKVIKFLPLVSALLCHPQGGVSQVTFIKPWQSTVSLKLCSSHKMSIRRTLKSTSA